MKQIIATLAALVLMTISVRAQANILDIENGEATTVGIYVKDLATGKVLADHNGRLAMTPASITKTLTSATALQLLGADFRFRTTVGLTGRRSATDSSCWEGDIVIKSCGDPTLESRELESAQGLTDSIVAAVKRLGINSFTGAVTIVDDMKDSGPHSKWECEDIPWYYGVGLYGFNYRDNYVRAYPDSGVTTPPSVLDFDVRTWAERSTDQMRGITDHTLTVWAPATTRQKNNWSIQTSNPDPAYTYANVLSDALMAAGIENGVATAGESCDSLFTVVYTHESPAASEIMKSLMKRSDNLFAEGMLRALVPGGSRDDCLAAELDYWRGNGLNVKATTILDGSGLSRADRFSPRFMSGLLEYMAKDDDIDTFITFFPIAGVDGGLENFGSKSALKGRLVVKTGSMSGVQCYAGYYLDRSGKPTHTVVVMVNGFFCPRTTLKKQIEKYLLTILK